MGVVDMNCACKAIVDNDISTLKKVLKTDFKSDCDCKLQRDTKGDSLLDLACKHSKLDCVKELIKAGAEVKLGNVISHHCILCTLYTL